MPDPSPLVTQIAPSIASGVMGIGQSLLGNVLGRSNMDKQLSQSKDLMDYQWEHFISPRAQARAYAEAGLNPAVIFGQGGQGASASPSVNMPTPSHVPIDLSSGVNDMANYILSTAQAKKAGMDTQLSEQEIKNKQIEESRNKFQFELEQEFGRHEWTSKIANEYMKLILASDSSDLNEQEKALNDYRLAISDIEKQIKGDEREMVAQRLANNPTAISLENRVKQKQSEMFGAQAEAAHTQADVNRENRRLQSALADVEESTKFDKIYSLISEYQKNGWLNEADSNEARLKASRLHDVELRRDNSKFFKFIDDYSEWLKSKVKIFGK